MKKIKNSLFYQLSPGFRRRFFQAVGVYLCLVAAVIGMCSFFQKGHIQEFSERIPASTVHIKKTYDAGGLDVVAEPRLAEDITSPLSGSTTPLPATEYTSSVPRISLIMTNIGPSALAAERALDQLPPAVTLALLPSAQRFRGIIDAAHKKGAETLVMIPMEPNNYPKDDPGEKSLLTKNSDGENNAVIKDILKRSTGTVGVTNFMGEAFLADPGAASLFFQALAEAHVPFIGSDPSLPLSTEIPTKYDVPYLAADVIVDAVASEKDIAQALIALEKKALGSGHAVGIIRAYPVTFSMIKEWISSLPKKNIHLVPVSSLISNASAKTDTH